MPSESRYLDKKHYLCCMERQFIFRRAVSSDLERIMEIIAQAKRQMLAMGSDQWQNGYPSKESILQDLERGCGYVLERDSMGVVAYGAVVFDGEAAYKALQGHWLTKSESYVVVHRLAVADEAKHQGVATEFMRRVEGVASIEGVEGFRIDTHRQNAYMLQLLEKMGFLMCGRVAYGEEQRLAFEKRLRYI